MTTPVRQQYLQIKRQFPDTVVLFRLGDFYETFDGDAKIVSEVCSIVLTGRDMGAGNRVPLAGVPYHSVESHLAKLIQAGHKVAIVEQTAQEPQNGLMARQVTRVVTPGTVTDGALLQGARNNYLAAILVQGVTAAIAFVDITTGEFAATELAASELASEIGRLEPAEVLIPAASGRFTDASAFLPELPARISPLPFPDLRAARAILQDHWGVSTLGAFGLEEWPLATCCAAAILAYLQDTHKDSVPQLTELRTYLTGSYMLLDAAARRNLELTANHRGDAKHSLLGVLDLTRTPMGARRLRQWISQPLTERAAIQARLDAVERKALDTAGRDKVREILGKVGDLERLTHRVVQGLASPRDLVAVKTALDLVPALIPHLEASDSATALAQLSSGCQKVAGLIGRAVRSDAAVGLGKGTVIADGFSAELDAVAGALRNAKDWVAGLERTERARTGIRSLKVGYNRVFGYYLEVTTSNLSQVPSDYIRKQTLTNGERYITPELKEHEALILNAEERMNELEVILFRQVCSEIAGYAPLLSETARSIATLDVLSTLAEAAVRFRYVRPELGEKSEIEIRGGRHPVVERSLEDRRFVPNDLRLNEQETIHIITGPNMAGKSTFLRQTALIVLMAQMGSFVPAESVRLGPVDRIYTRIGAQDAISAGQSTFMVEMVETANLLRNATPRSLLILDEIGRGTSTYDGIALARAIVEYLHNHPRLGAMTLFATHYHELAELEARLPRVRNYNVAVVEQEGKVVFLHRIVPGGADKSYGIHVAELAGVPAPVIARAQEILGGLEAVGGTGDQLPIQLRLFAPEDELRQELAALDPVALSPIQALNKLFELHQKAVQK